ncbi:MAG: hypothetical protein MHM6MM_003375 [Cercozoa sp. M6MM]
MKFLALALVAAVQAQYDVMKGDNCEKRMEACREDADCAKALVDYDDAVDRCIENACKLEGLVGNERAKKRANCDYECAVNPDDFKIPSGVDLQHSCRESEAKGRRADDEVEGQYEYEAKQQSGSLVPKGCYIIDKAFAAQQLILDAEKKYNDAVCDINDSKTVCAEIKKSKISPCSSAASVSATFAFGVAAVLALN